MLKQSSLWRTVRWTVLVAAELRADPLPKPTPHGRPFLQSAVIYGAELYLRDYTLPYWSRRPHLVRANSFTAKGRKMPRYAAMTKAELETELAAVRARYDEMVARGQ